jgi:hypothetical protein
MGSFQKLFHCSLTPNIIGAWRQKMAGNQTTILYFDLNAVFAALMKKSSVQGRQSNSHLYSWILVASMASMTGLT